MTIVDLEMVAGWAASEGWNPGKHEVESLYVADPTGYRLLEIDDEPVASLASVKYSPHLAFVGLYIVKPEFRGKGYGKLLWDISMNSLKECTTIGLNGVLDQAENYGKSGFIPSHLNTRWRGRPSFPLNITEPAKDVCLEKKGDFSFTQLVDYDAGIFSSPRPAFLAKWLAMPESHVLAAVNGGRLEGYGAVSVSSGGYKIAPLFADNEAVAQKLYGALCHWVGDKGIVYFDTIEANPHAVLLAKSFGLEKTFDTLRMYKGPVPPTQDSKIFGLTTLEIG